MRLACLFSIFLAVNGTAFGQAPAETALLPLPERLQEVYAKSVPQDFVVDPQGLLRGGDAKERREYLRYHSSDSLIDLYVVLFKNDQLLFNPGDLSGHLLHERPVAKPAVLIHYFMGRPERAQLYLSAELSELVPLTEQGRALENAVKRAKTGVSPSDELEKFLVQSSIGIYRMERLLTDGSASPTPLGNEQAREVSVEQQEAQAFYEQLRAFWDAQKFRLTGLCVLLSVVWWLMRWRRKHATHEFPDSEVQERLGGAHGAGVGAVLEFGKSSKPPAAQLEKLKLH